MATKPKSFKLLEGKKQIVIYNNITPSEAEQRLINFYLLNGFTPKLAEKKKGETIEDIRKKLDKEALEEFNKIYASKDKETGGYFNAMKYYNKWKKENKN